MGLIRCALQSSGTYNALTCTPPFQRHRFYRSLQFSVSFRFVLFLSWAGSRFDLLTPYAFSVVHKVLRATTFQFPPLMRMHFFFRSCRWNPTQRSGILSRCIHHACVREKLKIHNFRCYAFSAGSAFSSLSGCSSSFFLLGISIVFGSSLPASG